MGFIADVIANAPILSAWGNSIRDRTVQQFASAAERSSQWSSPPVGAMSWITTPGLLSVYNGTAWVTITPQSATVATNDTTTSNTYANVTNVGPAVSVQTATRALVTLSCWYANNTSSLGAFASVAVSGASTIAANESWRVGTSVVAAANSGARGSAQSLITGLTPGVNTFTMQYRREVTGGTANFIDRVLTVVGLP